MSISPLHKLVSRGGIDVREKKEINVKIGTRIKAARESAGLTQEKFAELVSLAPKNVSDIERGVVGISLGVLIRVCETLSVSSDELLFGNPVPNDVGDIAKRLSLLPRERYKIASDIINKVFEAFASADK